MTEEKKIATLFLLKRLTEWYDSKSSKIENDISILKFLKLIFFTSTTKLGENESITPSPFTFVAMPFGHVESQVYDAFKQGIFSEIISTVKTDVATLQRTNFDLIDHELKDKISSSVEALKNKNEKLILASANDLVELSHKYPSWINSFNVARQKQQFSEPISFNQIVEDEKLYFVNQQW